jgi:hypothetical protein
MSVVATLRILLRPEARGYGVGRNEARGSTVGVMGYCFYCPKDRTLDRPIRRATRRLQWT